MTVIIEGVGSYDFSLLPFCNGMFTICRQNGEIEICLSVNKKHINDLVHNIPKFITHVLDVRKQENDNLVILSRKK